MNGNSKLTKPMRRFEVAMYCFRVKAQRCEAFFYAIQEHNLGNSVR